MEESKRTHQDTLRLNNIVNGNTCFVFFQSIFIINFMFVCFSFETDAAKEKPKNYQPEQDRDHWANPLDFFVSWCGSSDSFTNLEF